jgi:hypothetical protein
MEVMVSEHEYADLTADRNILRALMAAGVDNWEGYDYAMELLSEG